MADDAEHSLFSASGAEGWSTCHGKPAMEEGRRTSSQYADEGTAAHTLASWGMDARIRGKAKTARDYLGNRITVRRWDFAAQAHKERVFTVTEEMAEHVDDYVDRFFLMSKGRSAERACEQRVHYHDYLGTPKALARGTSDGVAVLFDQPELEWEDPHTGGTHTFPAGDELQVHDFKYGAGRRVDADTLQLKIYGAGTFYAWEHIANFTRVRLVIHQPRKEHLDELVMTPADMLSAVRALRPAVPRVMEAHELAKALRAEGAADLLVGERLHARGFLRTSEKGCLFCDAQAVCPAKIEEVAEPISGRSGVTAADFEDLTVDGRADVREYGGNYLAAAYAKLDAIEDWSKAVRAEIDRRVLLKGEKFDGIKVVAGKKGRRVFKDQGEIEHYVRTAVPGPVRELLYDLKLKTPAQMEKALKTSPLTWARLQPFITQEEGKPAVVPTSDKRPAISHKTLAEEFDDLTAEEQPAQSKGSRAGPDRHPFR